MQYKRFTFEYDWFYFGILNFVQSYQNFIIHLWKFFKNVIQKKKRKYNAITIYFPG